MKISTPTLKLIQKQISIENSNHLIYLELQDWCRFNSYDSAAEFYSHQADGELVHRDKFRTYLLDIDYEIEPFTLAKVSYSTPKSLEDTVLAGLKVERSTTAEINAILKSAMDNGDYSVIPMIHWFVSEQVEEEMLFNNIVTWIQNSGCTSAPDWAKGQIRSELEEYMLELIEGD